MSSALARAVGDVLLTWVRQVEAGVSEIVSARSWSEVGVISTVSHQSNATGNTPLRPLGCASSRVGSTPVSSTPGELGTGEPKGL